MTCCQILYLVFVKETYNCKKKQQQAVVGSIELLSPLQSDSYALLINPNEDETATHGCYCSDYYTGVTVLLHKVLAIPQSCAKWHLLLFLQFLSSSFLPIQKCIIRFLFQQMVLNLLPVLFARSREKMKTIGDLLRSLTSNRNPKKGCKGWLQYLLPHYSRKHQPQKVRRTEN